MALVSDTIKEMPGEKQIAWLIRLLMTAGLSALGVISYGAMEKLDRIAETQARNIAHVETLVEGLRSSRTRLDTLYELHYGHGDRIRALELRQQWDRRKNPIDQPEAGGDE